jgi:hypothetical protein
MHEAFMKTKKSAIPPDVRLPYFLLTPTASISIEGDYHTTEISNQDTNLRHWLHSLPTL